MGAVHGVHLKYVGLSALSYAGYIAVGGLEGGSSDGQTNRSLSVSTSSNATSSIVKMGPAFVLGYSAVLNAGIAACFILEKGMKMIGKNRDSGQIPFWSYVLYFPFHYPNMLYTYIHTRFSKFTPLDESGQKKKGVPKEVVPVATEVQPGWWVGGCYSHELDKDWSAVIDLTVEFPEKCITRTQSYMLMPTWDGVPANPDQLEEAANFAVAAHKKGHVLIHCAHGRGRSTTVMCAALIKEGLYPNYDDALNKGIRPQRPVCKLNKKMRTALEQWQDKYMKKE